MESRFANMLPCLLHGNLERLSLPQPPAQEHELRRPAGDQTPVVNSELVGGGVREKRPHRCLRLERGLAGLGRITPSMSTHQPASPKIS